MKSKIGNINEDSFEMECINCGYDKTLATVAHRNNQAIVGFLIACRDCRKKIYGGDFVLILPGEVKQ